MKKEMKPKNDEMILSFTAGELGMLLIACAFGGACLALVPAALFLHIGISVAAGIFSFACATFFVQSVVRRALKRARGL